MRFKLSQLFAKETSAHLIISKKRFNSALEEESQCAQGEFRQGGAHLMMLSLQLVGRTSSLWKGGALVRGANTNDIPCLLCHCSGAGGLLCSEGSRD